MIENQEVMILNKVRFVIIPIVALVTIVSCKKEVATAPTATVPILTTNAISDLTQSTATTGGIITSDGGTPITTRGICWGTDSIPTLDHNKTIEGTGSGSFTSNLTELIENTTYYTRAYATNNAGTGFGNTISFRTLKKNSGFFGLDSSKIFELITRIEKKIYHELHSLLIVKDDSLIIERYFNGYKRQYLHTLQSVTKSFTSAIIGIALERGLLKSIDSKILDFFPQYTNIENMDGWKREIKIKDLLTMRSGTDYGEGFPNSPHDQLNQLKKGWDVFYLNRLMLFEPGTRFNYDSGGVILLSSILKNVCDMHADIFADQSLFPQLGITEKNWYKNSEGHPHTGGGLSLKPTDMIKLGMLYLHKGKWKGHQLIPENWVNKSFEMHVDLEPVLHGDPYIKGYGYLWWILKPATKSKTNQYVYAAMGALGQYIFVIPEYNMVVAVTGGTSNYENYQNPQKFLYGFILDAVL